ncbi:hypothetical protein SLS60_008750 [Paraconiothyrium brasiliense]|uniref:Amino acid permease/ SLC12A domain-containing protein n=1 Tax=Paraconiothyrium brasiliense TaxID=300254 RepID=A0ABR3QYQ0_9PLEO
MFVCTETSAVATVVQFWDVDVSPAVWVAMVLILCTFFNLVAVKWYGESEFVMSITKVLLLIGLVLFTFITMVGGNPKHDAYGFRAWTNGNAMHPYYADGATGRLLGIAIAIRFAVFTLAGPDFISLSAGEIQNPRRTIPRLAQLIFYRLVGFYIIGSLAVGIICSSRDENLLLAIKGGKPGAAASPWVIGIRNAGVTGGLPGLINTLILVSAISCGNAFVYQTSRTLYSLAQEGQAPKIFLTCSKSGIPYYCVLAVTAIGCITFLVADNSAITVFGWFVDLATSGLIVNFVAFFWVYLGWYRALKAQNFDRKNLPYYCNFAPYTAWFGLIFGCLIILFLGFDSFSPFSIQSFITTYFGIAWAVFMFTLWKVVKKTKFADPATVDIYHGKAEIDAECAIWESGGLEENEKQRLAELNVVQRTFEKLW